MSTLGSSSLGRLKHEARVGDPASSYDLAYTHDAGGNRLSTIDEVNEVETVYHHDVEEEADYVYGSANNRLMYFETFDTSAYGHELVSTTYYYYNNYGNITRKVTRLANPEPGEREYQATYLRYATNEQAVTYLLGEEWDWNGNPLAEVTNYTVTFAREFWYDGSRQRFLNREFDPVALTGDNRVVLSETWSDYAGDSIYADFTLNGSTVTVPRIYEPGIGRVGNPFGVLDRALSHADHIGTTRLLSDNDGLPRDESLYTAFGSLVSGTNHRYGYAGKHGYQSHAETPFLHLGARYYDPDTGRFLQRDPIGIRGGRNVYVYAKANPVTTVDPMGLWSWEKAGAGFVFGAIGGAAKTKNPWGALVGALSCAAATGYEEGDAGRFWNALEEAAADTQRRFNEQVERRPQREPLDKSDWYCTKCKGWFPYYETHLHAADPEH